jgi:hypothetical protein
MSTGTDVSPFFLDRFVNRVGLAAVCERLPFRAPPLVLWGFLLAFADVVVLQAYKYTQGYTITFLTNPAWLIQPFFAVLAAVGTVYLYKRYDTALELVDVENRTSDPERFRTLAPGWLRAVIYAIGIGYQAYLAFALIGLDEMLATGGLSEVVGTVVIVPLGYVPIFAEFITAYLGIMIFLPRKVHESDFKVHFLDPENLGGLRPIGELAKLAYYLMVVGLVGFLAFTYGPFVLGEAIQTPYPEPGVVTNLAFTGVWILTVAFLGHALYRLHLFMKRERENELARLEKKARDIMEDPFDPEGWEVQDEEEYEELRRRMRHVTATREYPTTFAMWSQILIGLILPKAIQLLLAG